MENWERLTDCVSNDREERLQNADQTAGQRGSESPEDGFSYWQRLHLRGFARRHRRSGRRIARDHGDPAHERPDQGDSTPWKGRILLRRQNRARCGL